MTSTPHSRFIISLDFELYWGVHDAKAVDEYREHLLGVRRAVPAMLELFESFGIHATWATVGFLFASSRDELFDHAPKLRPGYANSQFSPYDHAKTIGPDETSDPVHFAPSLIDEICQTDGQDIATHTFSHFYCLEDGPTPETFRADLQSAIDVAAQRDIELKSIVFPRNQLNPRFLSICSELGITNFRGNRDTWYHQGRNRDEERLWHRGLRLADAYLPISTTTRDSESESPAPASSSPVNIPASRFLRPFSPRLQGLDAIRARRIRNEMTDAARAGRDYHLWWHPHNFGQYLDQNLSFLNDILIHYQSLRDRFAMTTATMAEAADMILPTHVEDSYA